MTSEYTKQLISPADTDTASEEFSLVLFNDSYHEFDAVVNQIIKATGYSHDKAEAITMEAHTRGRAVVISGDLDVCLKAQAVLEEIGLRTSIEVSA